MSPLPDPQRCKRSGCNHPKHYHLHSGECAVKLVSGPPEPKPKGYMDPKTGEYIHVGRTVTPCDCIGYLA